MTRTNTPRSENEANYENNVNLKTIKIYDFCYHKSNCCYRYLQNPKSRLITQTDQLPKNA